MGSTVVVREQISRVSYPRAQRMKGMLRSHGLVLETGSIGPLFRWHDPTMATVWRSPLPSLRCSWSQQGGQVSAPRNDVGREERNFVFSDGFHDVSEAREGLQVPRDGSSRQLFFPQMGGGLSVEELPVVFHRRKNRCFSQGKL